MDLFCQLFLLKIPELWVPGKGSSRKEGRDEYGKGDHCEENLYGKVVGKDQNSLKEIHLPH